MTAEFTPRPLHLHTVDSLCIDLVSGRPVSTGPEGDLIQLDDDRARSALAWYRRQGASSWTASVTVALAERLVDAILEPPPVIPVAADNTVGHRKRVLTLTRLEAHRFAGLHRFGTPDQPPKNFVLDWSSPIQLFEGANGSGKTSLANAIIWALTGEILRPQREPEAAAQEFVCRIDLDSCAEPSLHKVCPVTPLPDPKEHVPERGWVHADTWVELTFRDESGNALVPIRRSISRTPAGKLHEMTQGLSGLGIDPIAFRIGTVMPGLLPVVRVGSESELGRAVAQLTGLSALADLSDHARRAQNKIDKEFVKRELQSIARLDESYSRARADLMGETEANVAIRPAEAVPPPSDDTMIEGAIDRINGHFVALYSTSVSVAKGLLGEAFDPSNAALRADLESNIGAALSEVRQLRLDSLVRLKSLRSLRTEELSGARAKLSQLMQDARTLDALSRDPSREARARLYAVVALWMQEHPTAKGSEECCVVCGGPLVAVRDPVTGALVKEHIHNAGATAALMSQTLKRWAEAALGDLTQSLPPTLRRELELEQPEHPSDLVRAALTDELFATDPFKGVLRGLRAATAERVALVLIDLPALSSATQIDLPAGCSRLQSALVKLDRSIRFAEWRHSHDAFCGKLFAEVIGKPSIAHEEGPPRTLAEKLSQLDRMVKSVAPLNRALAYCDRLKVDLSERRTIQKRIVNYATASAALEKLLPLGGLAELQVARLRDVLKARASMWRNSVYQAGFPAAAHDLLDTRTTRKGQLEFIVGSGGIAAPAHQVANASALRASLVGFYLAFWEHVLSERGGLRLMILDDPEELFDEVNRERLGETLPKLVEAGAQVMVTTHDRVFAGYVARLDNGATVEHRSVHPATPLQPVLRTPLSVADIVRKRKAFEADPNSEDAAKEYADECRVHIETMLSDLCDDPAYSDWVRTTATPTFSSFVDRIRGLARRSPQGMFGSASFTAFVSHPGVDSGSATMKLLNKPHHRDRRWITPTEVAACMKELDELVMLTDGMHEERRHWRHGPRETSEALSTPVLVLEPLKSLSIGTVSIPICPDLAAFTRQAPSGESQETVSYLDTTVLESKALFYLRRDNFGFAGLQGSMALVRSEPGMPRDRSLVIARDGSQVYARRVLLAEAPGWIGLAGETPDPRRSPRTQFFREREVALHEVVGILFQHGLSVPQGWQEAVLVDDASLLASIEIAYRVREDSAIPLVLPKQIALGGRTIPLDRFDEHADELVALMLDDGSTLFKRVGTSLPANLSYLRQFESIGGLGSSQILAVGKRHPGVRSVEQARLIIGVLYHG